MKTKQIKFYTAIKTVEVSNDEVYQIIQENCSTEELDGLKKLLIEYFNKEDGAYEDLGTLLEESGFYASKKKTLRASDGLICKGFGENFSRKVWQLPTKLRRIIVKELQPIIIEIIL
jgi:hypothetical protein